MKKSLTLTGLMIFLIISMHAQKNWIGFTSDSPQLPEVAVEQQTTGDLILNISVSGMYVSAIEQEGQTFQRLELIPDRTTKQVGKPELPMLSELIGIPGNKLALVEVLSSETTKLEGYTVYPFQTPTTDNPGGFNHAFVMDQDFYNQSRIFPGKQVYLDGTGIWRDIKITNLHLVPFSYNPASQELEVVTNIKVKVTFYGYDANMVLNRDKEVTPMFYKMYENKIINFESLGLTKTYLGNNDIKYLVITNTEAVNSIQPLVDWKNQQGFRVEVRTLEAGFTTPQDFKNYITTLYNDDDLEYVLMVGDAYPNGGNGGGNNDVPMFWWAPSGEDASYSDSWYTCMDGPDDHYADLAIGRFTYDNLSELELQIQKTMDHYLAPDASSNWAENSILIAHDEQYPAKYTQCCEEIRTYPYPLQTPIFEQAYGGAGYSNTQVVNYVNNNSCGIFNYRGHGSATELWQWCPQGSFTAQHVNQLTNDDRLFVFFDVCCDNMDIVAHPGNCLCEDFMKSPVASVAVNGAIIPSYTIPNHDYDKEMYKAVFEEGIYNVGYVTNFANLTVLNVHGDLGRSNVRTYLWLGDASLEPWTLQPANMTVNHDAQLFLGLNSFEVTVTGTGGPLENAMVCVSNDDKSIYGIAFTDASGYAQVVFDTPVQNPGDAVVTVTAHNFLPYQGDISVIPQSGPYVIKESYSLNDQTGGNDDGLMDYGESILLTLAMQNVGIAQATNVSVTISTNDTYITLTDDTELYGDIDPDETLEIADGFAFDVAGDMPDGHFVMFDVEASDNSKTLWNSSFSIEGHAPLLESGDVTISDPTGNNNGKLDPGETANLVIVIENNGSSDAFNVIGELSTIDPFVTINLSQVSYGDINGASFAQGTFNVSASAGTPAGHAVEFTFDMTADLGVINSGSFDIVVGQIPVLLLDLDPNSSSAPDMQTTLADMDISCEMATAFPADLNLYSSVFVFLGIYSSNHVLSSTEGQTLAAYLNNGGNLYMEGGDTWAFDNQTAVHSMFNINGTSDGSSDMGTLIGQTDTFTEGMTFSYTGENSYMDHLAPITPAFTIFQNQTPSYGAAVAYDAGDYKTIGASFEFGGLNDGTSPSTKEELMMAYLEFFNMNAGMQALFAADNTEVCEGEIVNFFDQSTGGVTEWLWTFEGGSPATSTFQNPMVAYFNAGTYDVTLEVTDGSETMTLIIEDYITVITDPEQAATPEGENEVCTNFGEPTQYTTAGAAGADTYTWELSPTDAGTISGNGTSITVDWTMNWEGTAVLKVRGENDCGEGAFSADFEILCSVCTGIDETVLNKAINIYPNPTNGNLNIKLAEKLGKVDISVVNVLNETMINLSEDIRFEKTMSLDLSDLSSGLYFVRIKSANAEFIKKIVLRD